MNIASPKDRKLIKILCWFVLVPLLLIVLLITALSLNERHHKNLILSEAASYAVPSTCHETSREYTASDVDAQSAWTFRYVCNTTNGQLHEEIVANLEKLGYKERLDYSGQGPSSTGPYIFYSFTYESGKYQVDYNFYPHEESTLERATELAAKNTNGYSLNISEN